MTSSMVFKLTHSVGVSIVKIGCTLLLLLLPSLGRQGQSAPCNIIARLCVCLSVCLSVRSINA